MRILVLGATGTVGSQVARELVARGHQVDGLTRGGDKALPPGVNAVRGDLLDPQTIRTAFPGHDALFLNTANGPAESHELLMGLNGALEGGIGRVVYMSVHHLEAAAHLPHFGAKIGVEVAVETCGLPFTLLRPNNFYQNDYWFKDAMLQYGVYPQPIGATGISRVDVRDIGEAAAVALTTDAALGETINLVGPEAVTGSSTAAAWSAALGREIRYAGDDLEAWEQQNLPYLPAAMVFDFKRMYAFFQKRGLAATPADLGRLEALLGHPPRAFADFARETARAWGIEATLPA